MSLRDRPRSSILVPIESTYRAIHIPIISGKYQLGPYLAPFQRYGGLNVEKRQFSLTHSYSG